MADNSIQKHPNDTAGTVDYVPTAGLANKGCNRQDWDTYILYGYALHLFFDSPTWHIELQKESTTCCNTVLM